MGAAAGARSVGARVKLERTAPARRHGGRTHEAGRAALGGWLLHGVERPRHRVVRRTFERRIDGGLLGKTLRKRVGAGFFRGFHRGIARPRAVSLDRARPIGWRERELFSRAGGEHPDRTCDRNGGRQPEH